MILKTGDASASDRRDPDRSGPRSSWAPERAALDRRFGTLAVRPDGIIVRANDRFLLMTGHPRGGLAGLPLAILQPSRTLEQLLAATASIRAPGVDLQVRARDGESRWLEVFATRSADDSGQTVEICLLAVDVSDRQSRAAEDRSIARSMDATRAVAHYDLEGTIVYANDRFLAATGYSADELIGRHHSLLLDQDYAASAEYAAFWRRIADGGHDVATVQRVGKGGALLWLDSGYSPLLDSVGRPSRILQVATDVTADRLRLLDLQRQVAAIDGSHCVATFDMNGTLIEANRRFLEALGYGRDDVRGEHHRRFLDPIQAQSVGYATFWRELRAGMHQAGEYRMVDKAGEDVWLRATYDPVTDPKGLPDRVLMHATVVTDARLQQAEHQGQIAAIHKSQCVVSYAPDGTVLDANDNFLRLTGYRYVDVRGRHHRMFLSAAEADGTAYAEFWRQLGAGQPQAGEYRRFGRDGRELWIRATYHPLHDMSGRPFKIVEHAVDVTEQKLQEAEHRGQLEAIDKSQCLMTLGLDGTILAVNDNLLSLLGYESPDVLGQHHSMLVEPQYAASDDYADFWRTLARGSHVSGLYRCIGRDGRLLWIQASYNPILDVNGRPSKITKIATDVTSNVLLAEAFDDARRQAHHDSATALPNRVRLMSFMSGVLAEPDARLVVLYLDLDRFKPINDGHGHHVGDRVLGEVAERLRRSLHDGPMAARIGGDEFVVACPGLDEAEVGPLCDRLIGTVGAPIMVDGVALATGLSIGVAISPSDGTTPEALLRCADAALYRSKQGGRGIYTVFTPRPSPSPSPSSPPSSSPSSSSPSSSSPSPSSSPDPVLVS